MKLEDFKPGDLLEITSRGKRGEEVRAAYVTLVNYNGCGCVTYAGRSVEGMMATGQGAFDPTQVGTTYYGLVVAVKIVGHSPPRRAPFWQPRPGDVGYDLMC
jgi:hypothetical protein